MEIKEQIVKTVVKSGNGGAVWVPKNWLGQEVVVILPEKPKLSLKEKIIKLLMPYLDDITAAFLYGSYARNEQTFDSDLDILVISKKKFKIEIKEKKVEINVVELEDFKKTIRKNPVFYQIIREAQPIINSSLLEELRKIRIDFKNFRYFIETTKEHIKSNEELLELDKLDSKFVSSYSILYSIMLRLRVTFIIECIITNKRFSSKEFKKWVLSSKISKEEYEQAYKIYSLIRDNLNVRKVKFNVHSVEKLLNMLKREIFNLEMRIYGKQKKEA